jgi:rhomboid family GlyGly-CTERM serine protease
MNTSTTDRTEFSNSLRPRKFLHYLSRLPVTLTLALAAVAIAVLPSAGEMLQFDRLAIAQGEFWRLATCHLAHWNFEHLKWDLLMFVGLGAVCECRNPLRMRCCTAAAAAAVSLLVMLQFPQIAFYRGLSGIDTALFMLLAIDLLCDAIRDRNWLLATATGGMLYGFAAKTLFEAATGRTIFVDQQTAGFLALVWDHVVAGAIGLLFAAAFGLRGWLPESVPDSLYFQHKLSKYRRKIRRTYLWCVLT